MEYTINDMEKCNRFFEKFRAGGWRLWQMQYGWSEPTGFHAWFMKAGEPDIEIVTRSEDVERAIIKFNQ